MPLRRREPSSVFLVPPTHTSTLLQGEKKGGAPRARTGEASAIAHQELRMEVLARMWKSAGVQVPLTLPQQSQLKYIPSRRSYLNPEKLGCGTLLGALDIIRTSQC